MRSEVIGKTMAIIMVMAMIATGLALLPGSTHAAGAYVVTGLLKDNVTDLNVTGVKVTITNETLAVNKNVTSSSDGKFSLSVEQRADYNITFEKSTYQTKTVMLLNATFNETTHKALMGIQLITPLPSVSGTLKELGTSTVINDVEVTIKNSANGTVIDQVKTVNGQFTAPVDAPIVDVYYKKDGYYDNSNEDVTLAAYGVTNLGTIFLEKIVPTPTIKVWGVVKVQGTDDTLSGAIISISAGDEKWITAVSDDVGYYEMLAYPGNFQIRGSLTGYSNSDPVWFNVPNDPAKGVKKDVFLEKTPVETQSLNGIISDGTNPLEGADVYLHSSDGKYVNHTTSNATTGEYWMKFYLPPTGVNFIVEAKMNGYFTNASAPVVTASATRDVDLIQIVNVHTLRGFIFEIENEKPLLNATVTIYSKNYLYVLTTKTSANGYYEFSVYNGADFFLSVDSEGYQSKVLSVDNIVANRYLEVGLFASTTDVVTTSYTFSDWNTIEVTKKSIIVVDNISTRFSMDRKFGMDPVGLTLSNGDLSPGEVQEWANSLVAKGVEKRDTKDFLTLNNTYYQLDTASYNVSIEGATGPVSQDATIYINSSYMYNITSGLENINSTVFTLVFNATYDTEFVDNVNQIYLPMTPKKYEVTSNITETNKVTVLGYNSPVTIDPMVFDGDAEKVTMTAQLSKNGTAKVKLASGIHYVMNSTYDNYTVIVAHGPSGGDDTTVKFSAEESSDKIGDISKANYSWNFGDGSTGFGQKVDHNFSAVEGEVIVRLVVTETGGNHTYRNITVFVDSQNPVAAISAVVTDSENVSYAAGVLTVNEDLAVKFSGVKFTDAEGMASETIVGTASSDAITSGDGGKGIIEKWYWSWGEKGASAETITKDGSNNITHTYATPGQYTLNMIATDVVSRESASATWTVNVLDVTAPIAAFTIKDTSGAIVTETLENKTYTYNASSTTDNFDDTVNLTFEWSFKVGSAYHNVTGMSVNYTFAYVGTFNVTLKATDMAGNYLNKTTPVHVNLAKRPNILIKLGSMVFASSPGTVGKAMTISVNITNDGTANATDIQTTFYIRNSDDTDRTIGTASTSFLGIGNKTTVSITWSPGKKGEYSIWANSTCSGEHSSQWWDNKIDDFNVQKVTVKEAPWVMPAIIVGIVVVIIVVFLGMRYFMRSGTETEETGEKRKKR